MRQVFMNLITNAVDAMAEGGKLTVRVRCSSNAETGEPMIRVTIADTGTGMNAQTQKRLFEPFYTTKGVAGTGLGLWVTDEIVRKHKGSIQVRSCQVPGRSGTTFILRFPEG